MTEDRVEDRDTADNYARWHRTLETRTWETEDTRRGVLISEILGDEDGPWEGN